MVVLEALVQVDPLSVETSQLYVVPEAPDNTSVPLLFTPQCEFSLTSPPAGVEVADTVTVYSLVFCDVHPAAFVTTALK